MLNFISAIADYITIDYRRAGIRVEVTRTRIRLIGVNFFEFFIKKNVPKSAQKYKRNVLMPPGHPIILLKSS